MLKRPLILMLVAGMFLSGCKRQSPSEKVLDEIKKLDRNDSIYDGNRMILQNRLAGAYLEEARHDKAIEIYTQLIEEQERYISENKLREMRRYGHDNDDLLSGRLALEVMYYGSLANVLKLKNDEPRYLLARAKISQLGKEMHGLKRSEPKVKETALDRVLKK